LGAGGHAVADLGDGGLAVGVDRVRDLAFALAELAGRGRRAGLRGAREG
jgi:hypothetical protein